VFSRLQYHISLTIKIWQKIPTEMESKDPKLEIEILSLEITLCTVLTKNIKAEKSSYGYKSLKVREKKKLKRWNFFYPQR